MPDIVSSNTLSASPVDVHAAEALPFTRDRTCKQVESSELARECIRLKVPGVSHNNGRPENLRLYSDHVNAIHKAAGDRAVSAWLKGAMA